MNIAIKCYGDVSEASATEISNIVTESYPKLGEPMGGSMSIEVFEKGEEQNFFCTHDALEGHPRVRIFLDRYLQIPRLVGLAGIRRQIVHSIIHGSLKYYLVKFPEALKSTIKDYEMSYEFGTSVLYSISMTAKEYEATVFLYRHGFRDEQMAYANYMLSPCQEEVLAWKLSAANTTSRILYLMAIIRDISCAIPLLQEGSVANDINMLIDTKTAHLDSEYRTLITGIAQEVAGFMGEDTFDNIEKIFRLVNRQILNDML